MAEPLVVMDNVQKHYGDFHALKHIDLTVDQGEVVVVIGPSGSGKSTLCRTINRLETITSGSITIDGNELPKEGKALAKLRADVGMVFQSFNLFSHLTILQNVTLGPISVKGMKQADADREARQLLDRVGVSEQADKLPAQLSGGQQQRVGVARALASDPNILLMDEPFGAVDPIVRTELQDELLRLQRSMAKTIVFVTHDVDEAFRLGDHVVILAEGGRIVQQGSPTELLADPADAFVASFIGADRGRRALRIEDVGGRRLVVDGDGRPAGVLAEDAGDGGGRAR